MKTPEPAFETLMGRHQKTVFRTAWRLLGTTEDAQDAAQEVFLRLYKYFATLDPERPVEAWLYRVTVNVCRDLGHKRHQRATLPLHESDAETRLAATDSASDPAARAHFEEEKRMIAAGLETLTPKERAALVLRDLEGLSTAEVARTLESSETTVRTHICRGRIKLKKFRDQWLRKG